MNYKMGILLTISFLDFQYCYLKNDTYNVERSGYPDKCFRRNPHQDSSPSWTARKIDVLFSRHRCTGKYIEYSLELCKEGPLTSGMIVHKHQSNLEVQKPTQHDWNLIIKKVDDAFAGNYTCATNTGTVIARYTLEIVDGPRIIHDERSSASVEKFPEGRTQELKCHFSGFPTPTVRWYRGLRDAVDTGITGEILRFPNMTRYASDTYICEGKNSVGSLNYTIDLQVNFPVEVDVMAEVINASPGEVVTLVCVVQGQPINDAYWTNKDGKVPLWQFEVTTEKDVDIPAWFITATSKVGTLGFHDFGDYTCVGEGGSSRATKVTRLVKKPASG